MEAFPPMISRLGREADHLPPSTAKAKNQWSPSSSHTDVFTLPSTVFTFTLIFNWPAAESVACLFIYWLISIIQVSGTTALTADEFRYELCYRLQIRTVWTEPMTSLIRVSVRSIALLSG